MAALIWRWSVRGWVLLPLLAPGLSDLPRQRQAMYWLLASLVVIAVGMVQPAKRQVPVFGWLLAGCLLVTACHWQDAQAPSWCMTATILLVATWLIAERGEWAWVKQAVLWAAWAQLPIMALQAIPVSLPWFSVGSGLTGSLGKRGACAALLALGAVLSRDRSRVILALAALATGSLTGVVPILAIGFFTMRSLSAPVWAASLLLIPASIMVLLRLPDRLYVWTDYIQSLSVLGTGFGLLPGGFMADGGYGKAVQMVFRDYHSVPMDWMARTGAVGAVLGLFLAYWCLKQTASRGQWLLMACMTWIACCQSFEELPVVGLLLTVWMILLSQRGSHAVAPI